tara:strand:+ start:178 stop:408 length:231 start_codon:yes stop_codon:yes gene_type:complete
MTSIAKTSQDTVENIVENIVENTPMVGGNKKTFLEMYKNWINKYKYILFFIVTITLTFIAHTQNTFIEIEKMFKRA